MHAEQRGDIALSEVEIEPSLAEVISYRDKDLRVGSW
jgi:hypothetical protein